jgi:NTP pyrophosphatase (non-canonical NTP hydrolase)
MIRADLLRFLAFFLFFGPCLLSSVRQPLPISQGKAGKYTEYSHLTGITTENQSTIGYTGETDDKNQPTTVVDIVDLSLAGFAEHHLSVLSEDIQFFAEARQWSLYHKPRNLVLALLGEAGELAEILQWEGDDWETTATTAAGGDENDCNVPKPLLVDKLHSCEPEKLDDLSQELADVSIYAIRLATVCGVIGELQESLVQHAPPEDLEAKQLFA